MDGHHNQASLSQFVRIPERYRKDALVTPYSWYISIFCGALKNQVTTAVKLEELDIRNKTLSSISFSKYHCRQFFNPTDLICV
jgi:hypothetical protein